MRGDLVHWVTIEGPGLARTHVRCSNVDPGKQRSERNLRSLRKHRHKSVAFYGAMHIASRRAALTSFCDATYSLVSILQPDLPLDAAMQAFAQHPS